MRELYNREQKIMFIDSLPQYENKRVKKNYENLFYSISNYEKQLNKDFCKMNVPEAKMIIASLKILSISSLITIITLLRDYSNWCIANGKTNSENSLLKIQSSDFDLSFSIQSKLLKSPEQLNNILTVAFGNEETAYQKQSKLIAWLLYYGFSVEDIKHLTNSDVLNFEKIIYNYPTDSEYFKLILNLMKECEKLYEIKTFNGRGGSEKIEYLSDSKFIIRSKTNSRSDPSGVVSDTIILNRIRDINSEYSNNTGVLVELTVDRIVKSGIFHRLYQYEKDNGSINKETFQKFFNIGYESKFTVANEVSKKKKDYENWKKAFEL